MFIPIPMLNFVRDVIVEISGDLFTALSKKSSNFFGEKTLSLTEDELMIRMRSEIEKQAAKKNLIKIML